MQIEEDCGHKVSGPTLRYDQNVLHDSISNILQNGLLYYCQPVHNPTSVEHLGFDCKVEYTNANQGIMPQAQNIVVQYMQSKENDLGYTFQRQIPSCLILYFSWSQPNQILEFLECVPSGKAISTISTRFKKTEQWALPSQVQEYAVVIPTSSKIFMVGMIVLAGSFRLSNRRTKCILYLWEH
jgi:hypothetical protein